MRSLLVCILVGSTCLSGLCAEPPKGPASATKQPAPAPAPVVATPVAPKAIPIPAPRKLETYLLVPEPRSMRSAHFAIIGDARNTVFTPAREISGTPGIQLYSATEFAKLGISIDAFEKKAREGAERLLTVYRPELVTDQAGKVRYAVYRGEQQVFACLLVAPSLGRIFEQTFGKEILVAMPDRNSLYVFPPDADAVDNFAGDLESRYEISPYAASNEVYSIKLDGSPIKVVGTFSGK